MRHTPRSFMVLAALALAACILLLPGLAGADDFLQLPLRGVVVRYHPSDAGLARQAGLTLQSACDRAEEKLGIPFGGEPVTIILARGRAEYEAAGVSGIPEWSLAVALPSRRAMVVDAAQVVPYTANDLHPVIAHELAHLALATVEAEGGKKFPLWFHEGVAVTFSGQAPLRGDRSEFSIASAHGLLIPFDDLEDHFPEDPADADLAYLQSEAFVAHLRSGRSPIAVRRIIGMVREGMDFDEAFEGVVGAPRATVEKEWASSFRKRFPWLQTLWELTPFFGLIAAATIIVFLIVRLRNRRQHRRWLAEERMWTVVGEDEDDDDTEPEEDEGEDWFS